MTDTQSDRAQPHPPKPRWTKASVAALFAKPLLDLVYEAQQIHRQYFEPNRVQVSTLLSIKTGACPEDCKYCPQSARYGTGVEPERLLDIDNVLAAAKRAKQQGATRFCMGAAWRNPKTRDIPYLTQLIMGVGELGLESCMTLGMLSAEQARALKEAGLDYYNHNIDTSDSYYEQIITTRTFSDRLDTLANVRQSGMKVCSGGIVGMGESPQDRLSMLLTLANLPTPPESVPINQLVRVPGTPMADVDDMDPFEFVRCIGVARTLMPTSYIRLSAGRETMNDAMQALCFMAGANSIFYGDTLLTTANPEVERDRQLLTRLGIQPQSVDAPAHN